MAGKSDMVKANRRISRKVKTKWCDALEKKEPMDP